MDGVGIAVGAELFQLQPTGGITAILLCGVTGDTIRTLVGGGAALGAL